MCETPVILGRGGAVCAARPSTPKAATKARTNHLVCITAPHDSESQITINRFGGEVQSARSLTARRKTFRAPILSPALWANGGKRQLQHASRRHSTDCRMSKVIVENCGMTYYDQVIEAAAFLRSKMGSPAPRIAVVLGSGLGAVAQAVASPVIVPYSQIPHFPQSTVEGHSGQIVAGSLGGAPILILQGRVHFYEGYSPLQVTFPVRVLGALGVGAVVLT